MSTKQTETTQAHVEKKNHLEINWPRGQPKAESELSKQLLDNFQTENSWDHK